MEWTDAEIDELATFFAKRMTVRLEPIDPADPPLPGDSSGGWRAELRAARDSGRLPSLARRVAGAFPDDANLQQACQLLAGVEPGRNLVQVLGVALSVGVAALVFGTGWIVVTAPTPHAAAVPVPPPSPIATASVAPIPPVTRTPVSVLEPEATVAPPAPPSAALVDGRCGGPAGALVGYWYAGEQAPGRAGDELTMPYAVNVRADYPGEHNRFDKRADVRCVLDAGDRIRLSTAPVRVPGGHYWVPIAAGDLLRG